MRTILELGGITLDVRWKDIKNVHLSVYPPAGTVRIAVPMHMSQDTIRLFAISKLAWIRQQQRKLEEQERESRREYVDRESHYVWERRFLLKVVEGDTVPDVQIQHGTLLLRVRRGASADTKEAVMAAWYRQLIKTAVPPLVEAWAPRLRISVKGFYVQQMKTKWGSCNPTAGTIRLNTQLAKKPRECLEYVVVHELLHLIEPRHGSRFVAQMDLFLPNWRDTRELLNRQPTSHERWDIESSWIRPRPACGQT